MLDGYFKAELVKARVGSSLVMSIETDADAPAEDIQNDGLNTDGSKAIGIGAGKAIQTPTGQHLKNNTPTHDPQFEPFIKNSNRQIASGMNVAYHKLCNDLAGINYSSDRLGELEERDFWMEMQAEFIDSMMEPGYDTWLAAGLMWGEIKLPFTDKDRFMGDALKWESRRWPWVDPLKDVQASTLLVQNGFETNESILNSTGRDLEEVYTQRKREQDLADSLGLKFGTDIRGEGTSEVNASTDTAEENDGSSGEPPNETPNGNEKPAKLKARELVRGMHPANAALWSLTEGNE